MEGYADKIPSWNEEITNQLIDELEKFSGDYFGKMHEFTKKTIDQRYAAKNAELFIKQNFQELIGMTDRKFIEHRAADLKENDNMEKNDNDSNDKENDNLDPNAGLSYQEKLKRSIDLTYELCGDYVKQEEDKIKEKADANEGSRRTSRLSITSLNLFETFKTDSKQFPPIIGSQEYKKEKYLGLLANIDDLRAEQEEEKKAKDKAKEKATEPTSTEEKPIDSNMNTSQSTDGEILAAPSLDPSIPAPPSSIPAPPSSIPLAPRSSIPAPPPLFSSTQSIPAPPPLAPGGSVLNTVQGGVGEGNSKLDLLSSILSSSAQLPSSSLENPFARKARISSVLAGSEAKKGLFDDSDDSEAEQQKNSNNRAKNILSDSDESDAQSDHNSLSKHQPARREKRRKVNIFSDSGEEEEDKKNKIKAIKEESDEEEEKKKNVKQAPKKKNAFDSDSSEEEKPKPTKKEATKPKGKMPAFDDSDDEDMFASKKSKPVPKKKLLDDSEDEDEAPPKKKAPLQKKMNFSSSEDEDIKPPPQAPVKKAIAIGSSSEEDVALPIKVPAEKAMPIDNSSEDDVVPPPAPVKKAVAIGSSSEEDVAPPPPKAPAEKMMPVDSSSEDDVVTPPAPLKKAIAIGSSSEEDVAPSNKIEELNNSSRKIQEPPKEEPDKVGNFADQLSSKLGAMLGKAPEKDGYIGGFEEIPEDDDEEARKARLAKKKARILSMGANPLMPLPGLAAGIRGDAPKEPERKDDWSDREEKVVKVTPDQPMMMRGNKKPQISSSEEEVVKPPVQAPGQPMMMRGNKKPQISSSEEEVVKPPALPVNSIEEPKSAASKKDKKDKKVKKDKKDKRDKKRKKSKHLELDDSEDDAPINRKSTANKSKKSKLPGLDDSEDEAPVKKEKKKSDKKDKKDKKKAPRMPGFDDSDSDDAKPAKAKKKSVMPMFDDSDDDMISSKKKKAEEKPTKKPAKKKMPIFGSDSD